MQGRRQLLVVARVTAMTGRLRHVYLKLPSISAVIAALASPEYSRGTTASGSVRRCGVRGVGGWAASLGLPFLAQRLRRGGGLGRMSGSRTVGFVGRGAWAGVCGVGRPRLDQDQIWIVASMVRRRDWLAFSDLRPFPLTGATVHSARQTPRGPVAIIDARGPWTDALPKAKVISHAASRQSG